LEQQLSAAKVTQVSKYYFVKNNQGLVNNFVGWAYWCVLYGTGAHKLQGAKSWRCSENDGQADKRITSISDEYITIDMFFIIHIAEVNEEEGITAQNQI